MGFRDFECFNQALLAKQAWRILTVPDCLMSRVIKSRYFDDGLFLQALNGDRSSYAWQSILWGRELLTKGLKLSVGNGLSVKVWADQWLEDEEGFLRAPYRRNRFFDANLMASSLIDMRFGRWNRRALEEVFVTADVQNLLRHQPLIDQHDFYTWRFTKQGSYSVKSGYALALNERNSETLQQANTQPSLNGLKSKIWRIKAPSKLKVFIWKAVSNALAVDDLLSSRGLKTEGYCQQCGNMGESINHLLFDCSYSRQVWALSDTPSPRNGFDSSSIFSNIHYLLSLQKSPSVPSSISRTFPWVLWYLWKNRNTFIFQGRQFNPLECVSKSKEEADLWFVAQSSSRPDSACSTRQNSQPQGWVPPPLGWLKCNVGAVWSRNSSVGGLAWVLRDHLGSVLLHSRRSLVNIRSWNEAQFSGLIWAMESLVFHKVSKVIFAVEDRMLVNAINRPQAWPSFSQKVGEVRLIARNFLDFLVKPELRSANRGLYLIAKSATAQRWMQSYVASSHPRWLHHLFVSEMCSSARP